MAEWEDLVRADREAVETIQRALMVRVVEALKEQSEAVGVLQERFPELMVSET